MAPTTAHAGFLGAAALGAQHADRLIVGAVRDVHTAIAARVFGGAGLAVGPAATVPRMLHDRIAAGVYAGVGLGFRGAAEALRAGDRPGVGPRLEEDRAGRALLGAVNGLIGHQLSVERPELTFGMTLRHDGDDLAVETPALVSAYPTRTDALVVFLHGLCETEDAWQRRSRPGPVTRPSYGDRLAELGEWTPVYVRANTALPVAQNAVALAALLERLVEEWPGGVRRLVLVGHSMGDLIARAACELLHDDARWLQLVSDVVTLATPHLGSPVERLADRGARLTRRVPELAPIARVLDQRGPGITDLHHGLPHPSQAPAHIRFRLVAGSLTRSPRHPLAVSVGDLLVQPRSALGMPHGAAPLFPGATTLHVPGAGHFDVLNHDAIHTALRDWLAQPPIPASSDQHRGER